jgi:hypothetical protein
MPLTPAFVASRIRAFFGAATDAMQACRAGGWVEKLESKPDTDTLKAVARDMRYVATKAPEVLWQKACAEWAGWLRWMTQVQFKQETSDGS